MRYAWTLLLWPGLALGAQVKPRDINGTGDVEAALVCEENDLMFQELSPNRWECSDPADDSVLVGDGGAYAEKPLPSCTDSGGNHLNYDQATNTFSCGTSSSGGSPHDLLSAAHSDTSAAAAVRGYLVRGNATPAWERFACVTDGIVPMGDGTDVACEAIDLGTDTVGNYAAGDGEAGNVAADKVLESSLKAVDAAGDEECLTYESTAGDFEWQSCGGGSTVAVEEGDVAVVTADTLDFAAGDFAVTAAGAEANIALEADPSSLGAITPTAVDAGTGAINTGADSIIVVDAVSCHTVGFPTRTITSGHGSLLGPAAIGANALMHCYVPIPPQLMGTSVKIRSAVLHFTGLDATTLIAEITLYAGDVGGTYTDICREADDLTSGTSYDFTSCDSGSGFPATLAADEHLTMTLYASNSNGTAMTFYALVVTYDTD